MILPMLRAVVDMLSYENTGASELKCARAVLAEIIKDLESREVPRGVIYDGTTTSYMDKDLDPEAASAQTELTGENVE